MPTIGELIQARMDALSASYRDLERRSGDAISFRQLHRLVTVGPRAFPEPRTLEVLSALLDLPVTTILLSFASALGVPVRQGATALEANLPPGTDDLTAEDREAIRVVTRALLNARRDAGAVEPT